MIEDIEAEKVGIVLVKDMSRLGRLNAMVTYYTDLYFPDHDVRFIAVNDSIDTSHGENAVMPFVSILNEYYAKDISKKVRSAKRTMALAGKHSAAVAPYGYMISPEDKYKIIPDEEAAEVVKRIFEMSARGLGYYQIARELYKEKIPVPTAREYAKTGKKHRVAGYSCNYVWSGVTIKHILSNQMYLGHMVNGRTSSKSYKNKKAIWQPESEWIIVPNTHTPLISQSLYDDVQRICHIKKRPRKDGVHALFQGMLRCADCGRLLSFCRSPNGSNWYECSKYRMTVRAGLDRLCSYHRISEEALIDLVLTEINKYIHLAEEPNFAETLLHTPAPEKGSPTKREHERANRRVEELRSIIRKLVEKNALEVINDSMFTQLYSEYQAELKDVEDKVARLEAKERESADKRKAVAEFASLIRTYTTAQTELTCDLLRALIDKIVVHEPEGAKWSKTKTYKVEIHFKGVGCLSPRISSYKV